MGCDVKTGSAGGGTKCDDTDMPRTPQLPTHKSELQREISWAVGDPIQRIHNQHWATASLRDGRLADGMVQQYVFSRDSSHWT